MFYRNLKCYLQEWVAWKWKQFAWRNKSKTSDNKRTRPVQKSDSTGKKHVQVVCACQTLDQLVLIIWISKNTS